MTGGCTIRYTTKDHEVVCLLGSYDQIRHEVVLGEINVGGVGMSFYRPLSTRATYKLSGRILLVVSSVPSPSRASHDRTQPVVSVGNVAQLAADLLIASLKLDRVGIFDPKYLVPVVGAREDGTAGLTTPIERKSPPVQPVETSGRVMPGQYSARRTARSRSSSNVPPCSG
jgi:hypothetical protein